MVLVLAYEIIFKKNIHVYICHEHVYSQCLTYFKWKCSTITYLISESSRVYIHDV